MTPARIALLAQLASTLPLVGLIWLIQVVQYPLFASVGSEHFARYHAGHSQLITLIVGPLMLVELVASIAWLSAHEAVCPPWLSWVLVALTMSMWLVTMFVSVPMHNVLSQGFDAGAHRVLVQTNWLRTAGWTLRGIALLWVLAQLLAPTEHQPQHPEREGTRQPS